MNDYRNGWPKIELKYNHDEQRWELDIEEVLVTKERHVFQELDHVLNYLKDVVYDYENN